MTRWSPLIPAGDVLDLACGRGRHSRYLAAKGYRVLALDRDPDALASLGGLDDGELRPLLLFTIVVVLFLQGGARESSGSSGAGSATSATGASAIIASDMG